MPNMQQGIAYGRRILKPRPRNEI